MKYILVILLSYLIGSIPAGYVIGKIFFNQDIRKMGSGNVGSTNALRNFGKLAGLGTFLFDFSKAIVACIIGKKLAGEEGIYLAMFFVVIGHMYSFVLNFKAGKGIATIFGALVYINPVFALTLFTVFLVVMFASRIVSLASMSAALVAIVYGIYKFGINSFTICLSSLALMIIYKHKDNFRRLIKGEEKKIF